MTSEGQKDIDRLFEECTPIDDALNAAVRDAVLRHRQQRQPLAVWRDGKTVWLTPEEIDKERSPD